MKVNRLMIEILKYKLVKENEKKTKDLVFDPKYNPKRNIPYIGDNNEHHKFDLYYASKDKKHSLIIDIHGGSYLFGHRKENYLFGTNFLDAGFDFIAIDYVANNGHMDTLDIIDQCIKCIVYIIEHLKELGLEDDRSIALTGDSAGGHLALTIAELFNDKEYQKLLGYELPEINLVAVLLNCPVFNFTEVGLNNMTRGANKRMFGPKWNDLEHRKKLCPCYHIASLKAPLFVSTCKNDFLRASESLKLKETMKTRPNIFTFLDIDEDDPRVGHVHNLLDINLEASKKVNQAMIDFINKQLKTSD